MLRVNLNAAVAVVCISKDRTLPVGSEYMLCTLLILAD